MDDKSDDGKSNDLSSIDSASVKSEVEEVKFKPPKKVRKMKPKYSQKDFFKINKEHIKAMTIPLTLENDILPCRTLNKMDTRCVVTRKQTDLFKLDLRRQNSDKKLEFNKTPDRN